MVDLESIGTISIVLFLRAIKSNLPSYGIFCPKIFRISIYKGKCSGENTYILIIF